MKGKNIVLYFIQYYVLYFFYYPGENTYWQRQQAETRTQPLHQAKNRLLGIHNSEKSLLLHTVTDPECTLTC